MFGVFTLTAWASNSNALDSYKKSMKIDRWFIFLFLIDNTHSYAITARYDTARERSSYNDKNRIAKTEYTMVNDHRQFEIIYFISLRKNLQK